jgi:protein-disulfide isomerase
VQFKRNPEIFRFLLEDSGYKEIPVTPHSLILGDPAAPVMLTAFLSLYCNPCANAFKQLKALIDNCPEVKVNAIFSVYNDEESKKLMNTLYYIYKNREAGGTAAFLYQWYSMPKQNRKTLYEKEQLPEGFDITGLIGEKNKKLFEEYKVAGTPTIFVSGYKFPAQYDYSDMEYYMDNLKKLNGESKRQEACVNCR